MTTYDYLTNRTAHTQAAGLPAAPIDYIGATLYGTNPAKEILASPDGGVTWSYVCDDLGGGVTAQRILATSGTEVLLATFGGVWKSSGWGTGSVSWNQTLDVTDDGAVATPNAYVLPWGFDGYGDNFIATHYAHPPNWAESRYVWISTDAGTTWVQVWDSEVDAPSADPTDSHMHAICYDRWDDKFYLSEGHGDSNGVYVSGDDGASWTVIEPNGLVGGASPTVIVATDDGIVFGSDNGNDGIWVLPRGLESGGLLWVWEWESSYGASLNGFALKGVRDAGTGIVYVGFRSDRADLPAPIAASDGVTAGNVWFDDAAEGLYSNLAAYNGRVCGQSSRDAVNVFFKVSFRGDTSMTHITMPGTSGNYASSADTNLLNADTAHAVQSKGNWVNANGGNVLTAVDSVGSGFADRAVQVVVGSTGTLRHVNTGSGATKYAIVPGAIAGSVTIKNISVTQVPAILQLHCRTAGDASVNTVASNINFPAIGETATFNWSGTANATSALGYMSIIISNAIAAEEWELSAACVRQDGGTGFVPSLRIVGDLDMRAKAAATDWTAAGNQTLIHKAASNNGYSLQITTGGELLAWHGDGTDYNPGTSSGAALTDGTAYDLRATMDISTGVWAYYKDGVAFDTDTLGAITATPDTTTSLLVGAATATTLLFAGDLEWAEIRDGIDGPVVARVDSQQLVDHVGLQAGDTDTYTGDTDRRVWTVNGADNEVRWDNLEQQGTDAVMSHLHNLDSPPASLEVVGALNEMNSTDGIEYRKALRTYLNII